MNKKYQELDNEFRDFGNSIDKFRDQLDLKIEISALKPIWKNFERFSLYDDLKGLYDKVLPELAKFE